MGKSNNINHKLNKFYQRENNLKNFLKKDEIKILEKINDSFIDNFISFLSNLLKKNIEFVSYNFKIGSYDFKNINNLQCVNLLEISPYKENSFVLFYNNFLSVIVDLLFGGVGNFANQNNKIINMTDTDIIFNKKIMKFITYFLSKIYHEYFDSKINFINKKIFFNSEFVNFNNNSIFFIKNFHFKIHNIDLFFDILIPKYIFDKVIIKNNSLNDENINTITRNKNKIAFEDIQDVELNIIAKIASLSISKDKLYNLSKGDILPIKKPDKIIGYIENQPIFFADYKRFNEKSIIFIEEFIKNNIELNQEKES